MRALDTLLSASRRCGANRAFALAVLVVCALLLIDAARFDHERHLPEQYLSPTDMLFTVADGDAESADVDYGRPVELPHRWESEEGLDSGWYTARIPVYAVPRRPWALYLPDIASDTTVYLNDQVLGDALGHDDVRGRSGRRPLYLSVPPGAWKVGDNELRIRIDAAPANAERLTSFYLGMDATLGRTYAGHVFQEITVPLILAALLAFSSAVMGVVWLQRRTEHSYAWFALVCGVWSALCYLEVLDLRVFPAQTPDPGHSVLLLALALCVSRFTAPAAAPPPTRSPVAHSSPLVAALLVLGAASLHWWPDAFDLTLCVVSVGVLAHATLRTVRLPLYPARPERFFLALTLVMLTMLVAANAVAGHPLLAAQPRMPSIAFAAPLFVVFVGWRLIRDLVRSGNQLETLNAELEARIEARTAELEAQHRRLRSLERDQVLLRERERLMQEMHDGMGAHLVSLLAMVDGEPIDAARVRASVRDALQDLRLMIDSLDPVDDDLGFVLGMYRQRASRQLEGSGVKLVWNVGDTTAVHRELTPHTVLQILRIVQEAVSNALKHSGSPEVRIAAGSRDGAAVIEIRDRGPGMNGGEGACGRGLANMRRRAASIGAELSLTSDAEGFRVRLVLADDDPAGGAPTETEATGPASPGTTLGAVDGGRAPAGRSRAVRDAERRTPVAF